MIKDEVIKLVEESYQKVKARRMFSSKEEYWGMLTAETQRAVQTINDYARCNDQIFELCIKGAMPIHQCNNDKGTNITDIMLEKAIIGITELVKCVITLKQFKNPGIKEVMEVEDVLDKKEK